MTWMDLIVGSLSAAYLADYCERRWRAHPCNTRSPYRFTSVLKGPELPLKLMTQVTAYIQHWLSHLHWAALSVVLILTLAEHLPVGLAYGFLLPIYVSAVAMTAKFARQLDTSLRPNVVSEENAKDIRAEVLKHVLQCGDCKRTCEEYWRRGESAGTFWSPEILSELDKLAAVVAEHNRDPSR